MAVFASPLWLRAPSFSAVGRAVISLHPVSSRSAGHFGSDRLVSPLPHYCWSRVHGRSSAGLLVESQRLGVLFVVLPRQLVSRGFSPYFAYCPSSSVPNRSSFGTSASGFRLSLRDGVTLPGSGLSQSSIGSKALAPPSWCVLRVFAMGSPCRVVVLFQISIVTKTCLAHLPLWSVSGLRDGSPILGRVALSAPSIGTKASSIHLSLVASRWGHPVGRVWGFPHSIVTKLSLVSCWFFPSGWGHPTGSRSLI